jgi:hypothetical protein
MLECRAAEGAAGSAPSSIGHGEEKEVFMREIRFRVPLLLVLIACLWVAGCRRAESVEKVVIVNPMGGVEQRIQIYVQAGGLGGTNGEVTFGEFANVLERTQVGPGIRNARPGEWVRIRTIIQPREGWIPADNIRPAPKD